MTTKSKPATHSVEVLLSKTQRDALGVSPGDDVTFDFGVKIATGLPSDRVPRKPRGKVRAKVATAFSDDLWLHDGADVVSVLWSRNGFGYAPISAVSVRSLDDLVSTGRVGGVVPRSLREAIHALDLALDELDRLGVETSEDADDAANASAILDDPELAEVLDESEVYGALAHIRASFEDDFDRLTAMSVLPIIYILATRRDLLSCPRIRRILGRHDLA